MSELKSCPLCRGHIAFHGDDECSGCHLLVCDGCRAIFDLSNSVDPGNQCESLVSLRQAITLAWNSRAEPEKVEPVWIPVSERLPSERCLAFTPDNTDKSIKYRIVPAGLFRQAASDATHWMPLPAAPQQEQK